MLATIADNNEVCVDGVYLKTFLEPNKQNFEFQKGKEVLVKLNMKKQKNFLFVTDIYEFTDPTLVNLYSIESTNDNGGFYKSLFHSPLSDKDSLLIELNYGHLIPFEDKIKWSFTEIFDFNHCTCELIDIYPDKGLTAKFKINLPDGRRVYSYNHHLELYLSQFTEKYNIDFNNYETIHNYYKLIFDSAKNKFSKPFYTYELLKELKKKFRIFGS